MRKLNNRAIIGEGPVTFVAIIFIIVVLVLFALGSAIAKKVNNSKNGVIFDKKNDINFGGYLAGFQKVVETRVLVAQGSNLNDLLANAGGLG